MIPMTRPIIAIIGRPNVGKSSLFNHLLRRREAIVSPYSGTTRDRLYAVLSIGSTLTDIVDTAGLSRDMGKEDFGHEMLVQIQLAVKEADGLIFVLDGQSGLTHDDLVLAEVIRKSQTSCVVFINKVDTPGQVLDKKITNLGLGETVLGSIVQRRGAPELIEALAKILPAENNPAFQLADDNAIDDNVADESVSDDKKIRRIALVGRPNVGKSTLFNALTDDERTIVSDIPGTTRDAIDTKIAFKTGETVIFTDTAGIRRRGKIGMRTVEKYSVLRALRSIDRSDIVLLVADAPEGLTRGDAHIATYVLEQKKQLITVFNKTDLIDNPKNVSYRRFPFLSRLPMIFISAKEKTFLDELIDLILEQLRNAG